MKALKLKEGAQRTFTESSLLETSRPSDRARDHPAKKILIRGIERNYYALVDLEMIKIVKWLNRLSGVETVFSCQGGTRGPKDYPHVVFYCTDLRDLRAIIEAYGECNLLSDRLVYADKNHWEPLVLLEACDLGLEHVCGKRRIRGVRFYLRFLDTKVFKAFEKIVLNKG